MTKLFTSGTATDWLKKKNYPYSDLKTLEESNGEFDGGGVYGVEIPVINSMKTVESTIKEIKRLELNITRFNETLGSFLLSDDELKDIFTACKESQIGIVISLGPRPEYDIKGSFYRTQFGLEMGRRINNNDGIRACIEEAVRLADLGCRGVTVYDIGVLRMLKEFREEGYLPKNMIFKTSTHCMAANPLIAKIFAENGADSITTSHDLALPVLHDMRKINTDVGLDIPIDVYKSKGGFIRFYELAEIVKYAAPVMLKMGASAQGHPYDAVSDKTAIDRVARVARGLEVLDKYLPNKEFITLDNKHYALPDFS